jgi:hypothetical protein
MSYTKELIRYAHRFEKEVSVSIIGGKFRVHINHIAVKDGYARPQAHGFGTTIEDACYDYIRRHRGLFLINLVNDIEIELI